MRRPPGAGHGTKRRHRSGAHHACGGEAFASAWRRGDAQPRNRPAGILPVGPKIQPRQWALYLAHVRRRQGTLIPRRPRRQNLRLGPPSSRWPPEGGHPGEAPNCRCRAEAVPEEDAKCDDLKVLMEEAWFRRRGFHKPVSDARDKLLVLKQELVTVQNMRPEEFISEEEYGDTKSKYLTGRIGMDVLSKISRKTARKGHRRALGPMLKR